MKREDVVLSIEGKLIENGRQFYVNLYNRAVGDVLSLVVMRGKEELSVRVPAIERIGDPTRLAEMGILGLDLIREMAQMFPVIRNRSGVVVAARVYDAPFWRSGLLPVDIIHEMNKVVVKNVEDLRRELKKVSAYEPVVILIERGGRSMYVDFEMS